MNRLKDALDTCLSEYSDIFLKDEFVKHLEFKIDRKAVTSGGGLTGTRTSFHPYVIIGTKEGQFTNKKKWLKILRNEYPPPVTKVYKEALEQAVLYRWQFIEYTHIRNKPGIGKFISDNPAHHSGAIVAHELAHAIHRWNESTQGFEKTKPHGVEWQGIYLELREILQVPAA